MTAPSLRSLGTAQAAPTSTPSFAEPAGAVSTDVIEIKFFLDGTNTVTAAPSGFAVAGSAPQTNSGGAQHSLQVYWARRSDAGAGPYTFTLASSTHVEGRAAAWQDCILTGNPYEATSGAVDTGTVSTAPSVSATSLGPDRAASYAATNWSGGAWTPPSGYTEDWDANNQIATFDHLTLAAPQTTTPQAVCVGSDRMCAWVGILLPIEAGSPQLAPRLVLPWHLMLALLAAQQQRWTTAVTTAVSPETGLGAAGLTGDGVARKVAPQTAQTPAGLSSTGVARKVVAQTGVVTVGAAGHADAVKRQAQAGLAAAGITGSGVQSTAASRAQTGVASIGPAGTGTAKHVAARTGPVIVGASGRGAEVKRATPVAVAALAPASHGTARHAASRAGAVLHGAGGHAVARHLATPTATRGALAIGGHGTALQQAPFDPILVSLENTTGVGGAIDGSSTGAGLDGSSTHAGQVE